MFKEVDLGWNERVFGGMGLFNLILLVRRHLLRTWRTKLRVCLAGSFIVGFVMVQVIYP